MYQVFLYAYIDWKVALIWSCLVAYLSYNIKNSHLRNKRSCTEHQTR